ncbi:sporulation protein, partial [Bacillus inaquosorum]|nr:sporulation protein [Bacillus inaquosorum]
MKKWMAGLLLAAVVFLCLVVPQPIKSASLYDKVLYFPLSRYPET